MDNWGNGILTMMEIARMEVQGYGAWMKTSLWVRRRISIIYL